MEDKRDIIRTVAEKLFRIVKKQSRLEKKPLSLTKNITVTPTESYTIQAIGENHAINITELSGILGISKSAVSQTIAKLSNKGLLSKKKRELNDKEVCLHLTPLGQKALELHKLLQGEHLEAIENRLTPFSLSQVATVMVILETIETILDEKLEI